MTPRRLRRLIVAAAAAALLLGAAVWAVLILRGAGDGLDLSYVKTDLIRVNENSRPGLKLETVRNIVIHYVGNPGSSAKANRNYFDRLGDPKANPAGTAASAHFVVGLEGEVLQCIPVTEIAYANYPRNGDTVSVEVCHPDESGEFLPATYATLVRLTSDLCRHFGLTEKDVIRHYDVSGKLCPKYYAENAEAWQSFLKDVAGALQP